MIDRKWINKLLQSHIMIKYNSGVGKLANPRRLYIVRYSFYEIQRQAKLNIMLSKFIYKCDRTKKKRGSKSPMINHYESAYYLRGEAEGWNRRQPHE